MSIVFNKFNAFVADVNNKVHNLGSDQLVVALTDTLPVATNAVLSDITQISYTNLSSRNVTVTASSQSSGTYKLVANQLTLSATGTVAQWRYVVLYNSTPTNKNLIGWYDSGSEQNMLNGDQVVVGFDLTNGVLTEA